MRQVYPVHHTTRRAFLRAAAGTVAAFASAGILQACGGSTAPTATGTAGTANPASASSASGAPTSGAAPAGTAGAQKRGGTLTTVVQNDWVRLDPMLDTGSGAGFSMLFDSWVRWVKDPKTGVWGPQPELIAQWDLKPNEMVFKLQTGVKFHDGTPWDAKAAKWNLDRLLFYPQSRDRGTLTGVDVSMENKDELAKLADPTIQTFDYSSKAIEVVDDMTVRIKLLRPIASILATLGDSSNSNSPISPTAFQKLGRDEFSRNPVGAGPFKFVEWVPNTRLVLERNPNYWKMAPDGKPLPYLDKLIYRLVIDDSVRLLEVKSGNAQFTESVQGKDIAGVKTDPNFVFIDTDGQGISRRMPFDGKNPASPFVKYPELRKAMLYALDRETIAKTLGFEAGTPDRYMFGKSSFAYDDTMPYYAFDKAKAQQIVKDVIAKDPSVAGPNGKIPGSLTIISRVVDRQQSEIIAKMAGDVGIDLQIEVLERAAFVSKIVQLPGKPASDYMISTVQNPILPGDPDATLRQVLHSNGGQNYPHVGPFDELIDKGASTYDVAARKATYKEFMQKDYDLALIGYIWFQKYNWLHSKKLKNFTEPPGSSWYFTDVSLE